MAQGGEGARQGEGIGAAGATDLHQRLLDAGKPAELYSYRGAGHSFWTGSAAYNALMARSIAFFDAHLRADP